MLNKSRINARSFAALIAVNLIYLILVVSNIVEGIFTFWIIFIFLSLLPIIIEDKRNMIAIIVFLIPLEITKAYIPFFQTVEISEGIYNSVFDLARLFMLYSFLIWFFKDLGSFTPFIKNRISYIVLIFIGYYLVSALLISPDTSKGLTETFRYLIYFLFFSMVIQSLGKVEDYKLILKVMVIVAVILSIEGIFEYVFDYRLWLDKGRRACATFLDPNIFARFLDVVIAALLILRLKKIYIFKQQYMDIALVLCSIALLLTVSRQGMAILYITLLVISFFVEKRTRNIMWIGLILVVVITIPLMTQMMSIRQDTPELYDIGSRVGLLIGGVLMFLGSPLYGVGAGGFQDTMIGSYLEFLPWGIESPTLSHTYIVTVLAELGIVGFIIFCIFLLYVYKQFKSNFQTQNKELKAYSLIILTSIIVVFVGAQVEARFFEEPLLWLFLGMGVSIEKIVKREKNKENTDYSGRLSDPEK